MTRRRRSDDGVKPAWQSKINVIQAISLVVVILESTPFLDVIPDGYEKYLAAIVFALTAFLRTYYTDSATSEGVRAGTAQKASEQVADGPNATELSDEQLARILLSDGQIRRMRNAVADELERRARDRVDAPANPLIRSSFVRRPRES